MPTLALQIFPRFRIVSQQRDNSLTIEIIGYRLFFDITAQEILDNEDLLSGFTHHDVKIITFIANSSPIKKV